MEKEELHKPLMLFCCKPIFAKFNLKALQLQSEPQREPTYDDQEDCLMARGSILVPFNERQYMAVVKNRPNTHIIRPRIQWNLTDKPSITPNELKPSDTLTTQSEIQE